MKAGEWIPMALSKLLIGEYWYAICLLQNCPWMYFDVKYVNSVGSMCSECAKVGFYCQRCTHKLFNKPLDMSAKNVDRLIQLIMVWHTTYADSSFYHNEFAHFKRKIKRSRQSKINEWISFAIDWLHHSTASFHFLHTHFAVNISIYNQTANQLETR